MRYRLRTLMVLLALGPPILAGIWSVRAGILDVASVLGIFAGVVLAAFMLGIWSAILIRFFGF